MKKLFINMSLSILLFLSIISSLASITLLNDDYIKWVFNKNDIYSDISSSITASYTENDKIKDYDTDQVKRDIDTYISNRYVESNSIKDKELYYNHIYFMGNNDIKKYSYIIYAITLILIILTGNIFLHTKKKHNLDMIMLISSLMVILSSGYVYVFISFNNNIIDTVINNANHILLAVGVVLFELVFLKYGNIFIHKKIAIKKS